MALAEYIERRQDAHLTALDGAVPFSLHARQRRAQRGISGAAINWALRHGRVIHAAGARFLFFGRREVAEACAGGAERREIERCRGLVVLLSDDNEVITVYRNERALSDIRRKTPFGRRTQRRWL